MKFALLLVLLLHLLYGTCSVDLPMNRTLTLLNTSQIGTDIYPKSLATKRPLSVRISISSSQHIKKENIAIIKLLVILAAAMSVMVLIAVYLLVFQQEEQKDQLSMSQVNASPKSHVLDISPHQFYGTSSFNPQFSEQNLHPVTKNL